MMMRRKIHKVIAMLLVVTMLVQISPFSYGHSVLARHELDLASIFSSLSGRTALASYEPGTADPQPRAPALLADCFSLYLPLVLRSADGKSITSGSRLTFGPAAKALTGPDIAIISPGDGWTISGMLWFAVQSIDPVSSVTFRAGSTVLGTDTTPDDGFKIFLNASTLPTGTQQLSVTASNPCGETTETITVNAVPNPPSGGTVGPNGGVFASEIGSLITFPPGSVPAGTSVTVDEKTQQEITDENGFDWDAMGVTFLGAQVITSSAPISLPLGVASAGFGPRVQPGQAVVNYNILPDADGDGIDELVVVNTASVAPNDDVISDPVPQIQVESAVVQSRAGSFPLGDPSNGISGPPGTVVEFQATGMNPFSIFGNVAVYRSSVNDTEVGVSAFVIPNLKDDTKQTVLTSIPLLPPGPALLTLHNSSTGFTASPINIMVESSPPLSRPEAEIIDETLALAIDITSQISLLAKEAGETQLANEASKAVNKTKELRSLIQQVSADPTPEEEKLLVDLALMIESSNILANHSRAASLLTDDPFDCGKFGELTVLYGVLLVIGDKLVVASGVTWATIASAAALPAIMWLTGAALVGTAILMTLTLALKCLNEDPPPSQSNSGNGPTGMGSVPPSGGSGPGNAPAPAPTGRASRLSIQNGFLGQQAGRVVVKVLSSGFPIPFSGVTDAGGYFFIPLIPEGEPFVATALDTMTGETRTFEGVGPPTGESVLMFFDFLSEEPEVPFEPTIQWDGGGDGASWLDPLNWDTDTLPGPADQVLIDVPGTITVTHAGGSTPTEITSLQSEEAIVLSNGTLSISSSAIISNAFMLTDDPSLLFPSYLAGAGTVTVNGPLTWDSGTMSGPGETTANGGLTITGAEDKFLSGRLLSNGGLATWDGTGTIWASGGGGGIFTNSAGATFQIESDTVFVGNNSAFHNAGSLIKLAGSGTTRFDGQFNNSGTVEVQSGTLQLRGGGASGGSFAVATGATLNIDSNYTLSPGSAVTGSGLVDFTSSGISILGSYNVTGTTTINGGNVSFDGGNPITIPTLNLSGGGTLAGSNDITVTDVISWTSGTMSDSGRTIANGTLEIAQLPGSGGKVLDGRTLVNNGTATWSGSGINRIFGRNGAVVINRAGATFDVVSDGELLFGSGERPTFVNEGLFTKSGGSSSTTVQFNFSNSGTVESQSGSLSLGFFAVYSQTTGATVLNGGSFATSGGAALNLEGGSLLGAGTIAGDVVNIGGQISPGDVGASGVLTITGNYNQAITGTLNIELGGLNPGPEHDQLVVGGATTLDGTLAVSLINGFAPAVNDNFTVMTYGSRTGTFATINGQGQNYTPNYNATDLTLVAQ